MNVATPSQVERAFYTVKEMSLLLGRCPRWVYGHARELPGYTRDFGGVLFARDAVHAHIRGSPNVIDFPPRRK